MEVTVENFRSAHNSTVSIRQVRLCEHPEIDMALVARRGTVPIA